MSTMCFLFQLEIDMWQGHTLPVEYSARAGILKSTTGEYLIAVYSQPSMAGSEFTISSHGEIDHPHHSGKRYTQVRFPRPRALVICVLGRRIRPRAVR